VPSLFETALNKNPMTQIAKSHAALVAEVGNRLRGDLVARSKSRIEMIFAGRSAPVAESSVEEFVEQYVLDAHGVTDDLCARLIREIGEDQATALTFSVAVFEAEARRKVVLA
jgi:hypothetical protein